MVSTIAAALFATAIILAIWAIGRTVRAHLSQIRFLLNPALAIPCVPSSRPFSYELRRPVSVTPLRRSPLRVAA